MFDLFHDHRLGLVREDVQRLLANRLIKQRLKIKHYKTTNVQVSAAVLAERIWMGMKKVLRTIFF